MTEQGKHLLIPKIESGIVIDHIPAGFGLKILEVIHSYKEMTEIVSTVGLHYSSSKLGKKDMIKLSVEELPSRVVEHIAMMCSGVTIKRVKEFKVDEKVVIQLPEVIAGQARCPNPSCITNHERDVTTRFRCVDFEAKRFKCAFCERSFPLEELKVVVP